jgi:GNAT superfamily N-acetyltransferase
VNPAWYVGVWREAGFKPYNQYVSGLNHFPALFNRLFIQQPRDPEVALRPANPVRPEADLRSYHDLMNDIFPHQSLYCPVISFEERSFNMNGGKDAFDPNYCFFLEADGRDAGFIVAHPHQGRLVIKTLGVRKEYRGQHLSGLLIHRVQEQADRDGLRGAIYSTIRVGNAVYRMRRPGVLVYRRYITLSLEL